MMRAIVALLAAVGVAAGIWFLRDATMSTHTVRDPDSRMVILLAADLRQPEPGQSLEEYTRAKVLSCRTEVGYSDPVGDLRPVGDGTGTFRVVLQPSIDDTDRRQLRGCLEDWNMDHIQIDVREMVDIPAPDGGG